MTANSFLKNTWYVGGWASEFGPTVPTGRKIINEQVVFYRTRAGKLTALEDRCAHRWAPLSLGRVEGDDLRCMYHGLKFGPDGRCISIPEQDMDRERLGKALYVRAYPVIEKHRFAWIWMGEPALAREELIPDCSVLDRPDWRCRSGSLDYEANYALVNDNLLDLSHVAYNHEKTLGRVPAAQSGANAKLIDAARERGVRIEGWASPAEYGDGMRNMAAGYQPGEDAPSGEKSFGDNWSRIDYLVPGIYRSAAKTFAAGTGTACKGLPPDAGLVATYELMSIQAVTPMTARTSRYFFSGTWPARLHTEQEIDDQWDVVRAAFNEDLVMINAQQKVIDDFPGRRMGGIAADRGLTLFRKLMQDLMDEETEPERSS